MEREYKCYFHLQYINKSNDSKNQVIAKLQKAFLEKWSMRPMRLEIEKNMTTKKSHSKSNIPKLHVYVEYVFITTTKHHSFNNFISAIFNFHIIRKKSLMSFYISTKIMEIPMDDKKI